MEKKMNYIAPEVEVLEVVVEQGFAQQVVLLTIWAMVATIGSNN